MDYFYSATPFWLYSVIIIFSGLALLYGIKDMNRKKPGHPFVKALYFLLFVGLYTIPHRFINEYLQNPTMIIISKYVMWTVVILFLIAFVYFAYSAYRRGFLDAKGEKIIQNTVIPCVIVFIVCVIIIIYAYYFL